MREITCSTITDAIKKMCIEAATILPQDVEKALKESSLNNEKFSGLCIDKISNCQIYDEDSDERILLNKGIKEIYSLRYEEFIALNTHMIQKQQTEIDSLKKEIQELKEMILSL